MKYLSLIKILLCFITLNLMGTFSAQAADQSTNAQAEAMVHKAVAYIKANGPEKAYEEFTNGKSFKERDLYVIVNDLSGTSLAHGGNPKLVGKDLSGLKDSDGKQISLLFGDAVKVSGKGWTVDYKFLNPASKKMETKAAYFERVGDTLVGVGIYK